LLNSESILKLSSKIKLVINKTNKGRGFCRDLGVRMTTGNFILMVDATNYIEPDFIKKSMIHFSDSSIGAVSGALTSLNRNDVYQDGDLGIYLKRMKEIKMRLNALCS
jgi:glycosyltransferase involved in cell wall biosynthesis